MRIAPLVLAFAFAGFIPALAYADDASSAKNFSDAQKAQIEDIIKDYLTKEHPEVLMQAAQELQRRDQASADQKSEEAISRSKDKIYNDPDTPVGGNPKGDVTIVEFFDYQCGYCKMSEAAIEKLLKEDKKIKFIYKEFPILGPESVIAAKAAVAAAKQGKYVAFHDALYAVKEHLNDDLIFQTAKSVGLDVDRLKEDMNDAAVQKVIGNDLKLGQDVGVRGTPMFIIGGQTYPGALPYDQLKKAVDEARKASKKS